MRFTRKFLLSVLPLAAGLAAMPALAGDVSDAVSGLASAEGKLNVALFDKAAGFPKGKFTLGQIVPAAKGTVNLVFKDVAPGAYAVSVFHDVNDNGRLDANMVGIPSEPYGFSRDARGVMGPPKFEDAAVTVGAEPLKLAIQIK